MLTRQLVIAMIGAALFASVGSAAQAASVQLGAVKDKVRISDTENLAETKRYFEFPSRPALRDSGPIRFAQQLDIESRLPQSNIESSPNDIQLPPKPALREGNSATFILTAVEFTGVTAFALEDFAPLYDHLLARTISLSDISALVDAVTETYRREGYFLSRATAPAQNTSAGVLRINVAEGVISEVEIKGQAPARVKRMLNRLEDEKPTTLKTVERTLTLIGDLNGVSVASSQLRPYPDDLARHTLVVELEMDHTQASLYIDNRGTEDAGPIQAYAQLAGNSLMTAGDQLSAGVFFIPDQPSELIMAEMRYQLPVGDAGTYVSLSGAVSQFDAGAFLGTLGTESQQKSAALSIAYPFIRHRKTALWGNIGIEGRDIEEEQLGAPMFEDKLRIVYGSLSFRDNRGKGVTYLSGKISSGLNMLGASNSGGSLSRPDADGEFTKFNLQVSRYQDIGKTFGLYAAFAGQTSLDPLLASEEFAIGGANFGRAYDYGEILGDDGLATLVELRYGRSPNIGALDFYQLYGFYDYGVVWNDNAAPGFESLSMSSAGAGLRLRFPQSLSATFEIARPLDRTPFTQDDRDWRGFFSVSKSF